MVVSFIVSLISLLHGLFYQLLKTLCRLPSFQKLWTIDLRTFRFYTIPIEHNAVRATSFQRISPLGITASYQDHFAKGLMVLDPGFRNTAVRESQITYIDGNRGTLQYRQYSIGYLFTHHDYEDVVHLLVWGKLPTPDQKLKFRARLAEQMVPDKSVISVVQAFSPDAPAFLMIAAGLSAWVAANPETVPTYAGHSLYDSDPQAVDSGVYRTLAAFATVVSLTYCHQQGIPFVPNADPTLSGVENVLVMMGRVDRYGIPDKQAVYIFNKLWILFADHEMTNSTATFLNSSSTLSDPISSIVASVASANGPLHAGAIDLAYKSFKQLKNKQGVRSHIADVQQKKCRLMGVGHRVYRTVDPRIQYLRSLMEELGPKVEENPLLEVALEIDKIVRTDEYFLKRRLSINADLYSSFVYAGLGFDPRIFTPFAMTARTAGVLAHWRESMSQPPELWRPRQIYTGMVAA
ncbi:citrate synthase [Delitschia confertaspora ATCC 74209]|uniref:Citrate synthase n=1 Tax=Delitschia confertaspora ATCC 74209 TaxID=1513339 RepID=A0A9P4JIR9_9PLEO|nr:citrate synthase [Delitschia confertaspora ATCC 74209]